MFTKEQMQRIRRKVSALTIYKQQDITIQGGRIYGFLTNTDSRQIASAYIYGSKIVIMFYSSTSDIVEIKA